MVDFTCLYVYVYMYDSSFKWFADWGRFGKKGKEIFE